MKRRLFVIILTLMVTAAVVGCAAFLEDDFLSESPHKKEPNNSPPEERIQISNFEELKEKMLEFIMEYADFGRLYTYNYDGDIVADIELAGNEIRDRHPIGLFMVSDISGVTTRFVTYHEIEITFEYKRTKQQLDEMINVATLRYLRAELISAMSDYREEVVFRTSLAISQDNFIEYVKETYYQNPRQIVMLPVTAVEAFPRNGEDRIFELSFSYIEKASILQQYRAALAYSVRLNAQRAVGETDAEILLSLANNLIASTSFDAGVAQAISEHGTQNFAATAYGALINGNAAGEGFAMAFKAMCDELEFDCRVVLGYIDGMIHAWNIVALYGDYYHIDVAMGALNGIETSFLKTDVRLYGSYYTWDFTNTVRCEGQLTYEDIAGFPEEEEPDEPEDQEEPVDPDDPGNPANAEDEEDKAEADPELAATSTPPPNTDDDDEASIEDADNESG